MNLKGATALITGRSAGIGTFKALVDTDRGSFDAVFATNVTTSTVCSTASPLDLLPRPRTLRTLTVT